MQPGFVDFQNFAHGFRFARREAIGNFLGQGVPKKPIRWDLARTVTQGSLE